MMANMLAFAETRSGELRRASFEAVTAARAAADAAGGAVHAFVAGATGVSALAPRLAAYGADLLLVLEHAAFANYNPEALTATIAARLGAGTYRAAFFCASAQGKDLAPRVAARCRVPLLGDVTEFSVAGDAATA